MLNVITLTLQIIAKLVPTITTSQSIQSIIDLIVAMIPLLIQEYQALLPTVQNIIAVLSQSGDVTDDQITQLQAASAAIDAHFEATVAAARAADAAAKLKATATATAATT